MCTKILEVNLFAFAYKLFHEDFSSIKGALHDNQPFSSCKKVEYRQMQTNNYF